MVEEEDTAYKNPLQRLSIFLILSSPVSGVTKKINKFGGKGAPGKPKGNKKGIKKVPAGGKNKRPGKVSRRKSGGGKKRRWKYLVILYI